MQQIEIVEDVKGSELEGKSVDFVGNGLPVLLLDFLFEVLDFLVGRVPSVFIDDLASRGPGTEEV